MKPVYIKMKAFGSYREETIDFAGVENGIFLITGDTGAGKTTIFDAITYALYDQSSGGRRDAGMMISQYGMPGDRTEVEFCFRIGDGEYTVRRFPEQAKYKRKVGDGGEISFEELKTAEKSAVELILPDGKLFPGKKKETDEKIKEIMGIDCQQFTQIAMLAQGDFLKLLHAESRKRREIFSKIFDTYFYYAVEQELEARYKQAFGLLADNRKEIENRLADMVCPEESAYGEEWREKGTFSDDRRDEILGLAASINQELEELNDSVEKEIRLCGAREAEIQKGLDAAKAVNSDFDRLEAAGKEKERLEGLRKEYGEIGHRISLGEKALKVEGVYRVFREKQKSLDDMRKETSLLAARLEESRGELEKLGLTQQETERQYQAGYDLKKEEQTALELKLSLYDDAAAAEKAYHDACAELETVRKKSGEVQAYADRILQQQTKVAEAEAALLTAKEEHGQKVKEFIDNQAQILRRTLTEGEPCPVCGSIHHVKFPEGDAPQVSKEDVDRADQAKERAEKNYDKARRELERMQEQRRELQAEADKNLAGLQISAEEKRARLEEVRKKLPCASKEEAEKRCGQLRAEAEALKNAREKADRDYREAKSAADALNGRYEALRQNTASLEADRERAEAEFELAARKNGFDSEEEYKRALLDDDRLEELRAQVRVYEDQVRENSVSLTLWAERTRGKTRVDVTQFQQQKEEISRRREELQDRAKEVYARLAGNRKALESIAEKYRTREELLAAFEVIKSLSDTAGGRMAGKTKLNFQTYVQRRYFKKVIAAANERLVKLSGSQFILRCRKLENLGTQGEAGLDLDVYSVANDQIRDVKSLSGGESFMAALSMALGLSDVIQTQAGRIKIDTMFIDEGFGSLDDATRNQALSLLGELSEGRQLIGIISHVSELRDQVEKKLLVTKTENGSRAVWSR